MSRWRTAYLTLQDPNGERNIHLTLNILPGYAPSVGRDPGASAEIDILEATYTDTGAQVPPAVLETLDSDYIEQCLRAA